MVVARQLVNHEKVLLSIRLFRDGRKRGGIVYFRNREKNCKVAVFVVQNEVIEEFQSKFEMSQSYKWQYKENFLILKIIK